MKKILFYTFGLLFFAACQSENNTQDEVQNETIEWRIVSLKGVYTEMIFDLGMGDKIVGVDVTSAFPEAVNGIAKVGHISGVTASGLSSVNPNLVFYPKDELSVEVVKQLEDLGIQCVALEQDFTAEGTERLFKKIAEVLGKSAEAESALEKFRADMREFQATPSSKKVCFIYARGAGTVMVAGGNTPMGALIKLVGAVNPFESYDGFVPLNAEAMVKENPDVFFMFETGVQSLGGENAVFAMEGVSLTAGAKNKSLIVMDGSLASSFGLRLPQALIELQTQLSKFK
jgi:iron complex transport system substrate-binding protein